MNNKAKEILKKALHTTEQQVIKYADEHMPETGKFQNFGYGFNIPFTENHVKYQFLLDELSPENGRWLAVGVLRGGTDRLISHYILNGTKTELLDFIKSEEGKEKLFESIIELSDKTDDYWD